MNSKTHVTMTLSAHSGSVSPPSDAIAPRQKLPRLHVLRPLDLCFYQGAVRVLRGLPVVCEEGEGRRDPVLCFGILDYICFADEADITAVLSGLYVEQDFDIRVGADLGGLVVFGAGYYPDKIFINLTSRIPFF